MNTAIWASLVGAGAGALEWRRIARRHPDTTLETAVRRARHVLAALPAALALLGVQALVVVQPDVTWSAPVWLELHYTSLIFGGVALCVSFVFGLAVHGALATRHRRRIPMLVSGLLVIGIIAGIQRDFTAPIWSELHERMNGDVVLQSSAASCAAASAANLARQYGVEKAEAEMAALLGTTRFGSSPAQVIQGLAPLGISCRKVFHPGADPTSVHAPAVLFFPPGDVHGAGHAVLLASVDAHEAVILDPLVGRLPMGFAELRLRWKGHTVECDPPRTTIGTSANARGT